MQKTELERYRAALMAKAKELSDTQGYRRLAAIESTAEEGEEMALAAERELAVLTLDRRAKLLREVTAALARIEQGTYGVCERCEEAIKPRRLDAIPWARYCVRCQEIADRGLDPDGAGGGEGMPWAA